MKPEDLVIAYQSTSNEWSTLKHAINDDTRPAIRSSSEHIRKTAVAAAESMEAVTIDNVDGMLATINTSTWLVLAAALFGVVIAIAVASILTKAITGPLAIMVHGLEKVSAGDLLARVSVKSKDEIGSMADALNTTVGSLHNVMTDIRRAADQTAASSEQLSASAQNISIGAQTQASTVEDINASVQELSRTIATVASNATDASSLAEQARVSADDGNQTVIKSIDGMQAISDSSDQIAQIIEVINQIANQTNLLALNAAIEAASAGEHGLGFAVVAEEVRKLAERSSQAAQEIAQLIDKSGRRVSEGRQMSQDVGDSLHRIVSGIADTAQSMQDIQVSTNKQTATASEVTKNVSSISAIVEENSASAEEMAASAEELSAQAQRLRTLVGRFSLLDQHNEDEPALAIASTPIAPASLPAPSPAPAQTNGNSNGHAVAQNGQAVNNGYAVAGGALYHE